ncbi:c-type cytochrome [Ramlibacter sp.]|uniref:c-type cytochrome n=1 Tax=Ramlibacter sp. TaxID=1917967 RepID=UPI002B6ACF50|nr:c-type cytochrome [Ramlibacter sp.]HWI81433.1 c-type cytochrome [Ramlibacter sp.]
MNLLFNAFLALGVACVTSLAHSQSATPAAAPAQQQAVAPAAAGGVSIESKVAMCMGCHNIRGYQASFPEVHKVPMIAGQSAKYIAAALTAYKNGDRKHPTMRGIAASLTEQDVATIASYYESLPKEEVKPLAEKQSREPNAQVAGLLQKAACVSCHGANFSKPIDPSYPKIAGQHADYLFVALKAYKTENNPAVGRSNGVMGAIAKQFSNAELKALASYVGSLDSELRVHPEPRFHRGR